MAHPLNSKLTRTLPLQIAERIGAGIVEERYAAGERLKEVERRRIKDYVQYRKHAHYVEGGNIWEIPCQVAMPSATQNEVSGHDAQLLVRAVKCIEQMIVVHAGQGIEGVEPVCDQRRNRGFGGGHFGDSGFWLLRAFGFEHCSCLDRTR